MNLNRTAERNNIHCDEQKVMLVLNFLLVQGKVHEDLPSQNALIERTSRGNTLKLRGHTFQIFVKNYHGRYARHLKSSVKSTLEPFYSPSKVRIVRASIKNFNCNTSIRSTRESVYRDVVFPVQRICPHTVIRVSDEDTSVFWETNDPQTIQNRTNFIGLMLRFPFGCLRIQFKKGVEGIAYCTFISRTYDNTAKRLANLLKAKGTQLQE